METIKQQIEKIEERIFYLEMIDHWDSEICETVDNLQKQLKELQLQIA